MKVFVAGKVGEDDVVKKAMETIKLAGHEITFDWTTIPHLKPYDQHVEESKRASILESRGLLEADAVVLLIHEKGLGMYVELGMAIATQKPVYVIGGEPSRTMFLHHPVVRMAKDIGHALELINCNQAHPIKS